MMRFPAPATHSHLKRSFQYVPLRPRFLSELAVVMTEDEVLVDGAHELHVFEGEADKNLLSALIPLLNGRRTLQELVMALPEFPASRIQGAVSSLAQWGLIEDDESDRPSEIINGETLAFLRRSVGVTGLNRSGREAYEKLQASELLLVGPGVMSGELELFSSLLKKTGIGRITFLRREDLAQRNPAPPSSSLKLLVVSIASGAEDHAFQRFLDNWCFEFGLSWLRGVINWRESYADIGPLFRKGSPCYECFHEVHCRRPLLKDQSIIDTTANIHLFFSLMAIEVLYLLTQIAPMNAGRGFQRYDIERWLPQSLRWPRLPGCPRCLPLNQNKDMVAPEKLLETALVFEDYVAGPQEVPIKPDGQSKRIRIALGWQGKRLLHCTQYALSSHLPSLEHDTLELLRYAKTRDSQENITVDELAIMLMVTSGIRNRNEILDKEDSGRKLQRWAATAGNLGSVELYVAVRHVQGLAPGFYFYQPFEHSLASFQRRGGALSVEDFMRRVILWRSESLPDVLIIFTAAFHRVAHKYGVFGYRLINMDAGAAMSQLHLIAGAFGVSSTTASHWADDLITEQLNLDPGQEHSTGIVTLSRYCGGPSTLLSRSPGELPVCNCGPHSAKQASEFRDRTVGEVYQMLYEESRLLEGQLHRDASPSPSISATRRHGPYSVLLPPPVQSGRGVADVLANRISVRHYSPAPVSIQQLATMLDCAHRGDLNDWKEENDAGLSLAFMIFAWRVQGLEAGVYRYKARDNALWFIGTVPDVEKSRSLFLQPEFTSAPLLVWVAGNLAASCARHGSFGHRQLLLRAGSAGHRLWMAALSMGLSGTLVAGVVPGAVREFGLDGHTCASLLAFVSGHAAHFENRFFSPAASALGEPQVHTYA